MSPAPARWRHKAATGVLPVDNVWFVASVWMALALGASVISVRLGVSVALAEILVGALAGNTLGLHPAPWIDFLASFGAIILTFLAGAEIDPASLRANLRMSLVIGTVAFFAPFLGVLAYTHHVAGWSLEQAEIAGLALSTTSVAVVYAVMVETGLNETPLGKAVLAACFVNDLGTVLALGVLFSGFDLWMAAFVAATAVALPFLPALTRRVMAAYGGRVHEVELKFLLLVLFVLGGLALQARSEAVLPAYVAGLAVAGVFQENKALAGRIRTVTFSVLTPFYFLKAGLFVSAGAVWANAGLIAVLFVAKMVTKTLGVRPLTGMFGHSSREGNYITALMATGLTFGTISALYGLTHGIITRSQYTVLVTVVILSAVVPTMVAQTWFRPVEARAPQVGRLREPAATPGGWE